MKLKSQSRIWKVGLLSLVLLVGVIVVSIQEASAPLPRGIDPETGEPYDPILTIPMNIVALEGTQLSDDLALRNGVEGLIRGWEQIMGIVAEKNNIWMQAGIQFSLLSVHYDHPDPIPPSQGGPGQLGDINLVDEDYADDTVEYRPLCESVERSYDLDGMTEIKIHDYVDAAGAPTGFTGLAYVRPDPCTPLTLFMEASREPSRLFLPSPVQDQRIYDEVYRGSVLGLPLWQPGVVEAHEAGHLLGLPHPWEEDPPRAPPVSEELMTKSKYREDAILNPTQCETARHYVEDHVPLTTARSREPPYIVEIAHYAQNRIRDMTREPLLPGFIDLSNADAMNDLDSDVAYFTVLTTALLPSDIMGISYIFAMNLDNNNATGVTSELEGVDAIAKILVNKTAGIPYVAYNLTLFDLKKQPVSIVDPAIAAKIRTLESCGGDNEQPGSPQPPEPFAESLTISIPESNLTKFVPMVEGYPMIAQSSWLNLTDSTPILRVSHIIPQRPLLTAGPLNGTHGTTVFINGTHFTPNATVRIMLNRIKLAETATNEQGQFSTMVTIPTNATIGQNSLWAFSPTQNANGDTLVFTVESNIKGDITGPTPFVPDNKVDIRDVATIAKLFGVNYPNPKYNLYCDIIFDRKIDIKDVANVAKNFGKTYP